MSFSWVSFLLLTVVLGMGGLAANYRNAVLWRENQILLDNRAIEMGQKDRATFRKIQKVNDRVSILELNHHLFHACAKIPQTAAKCLPRDLALEAQIRALLSATEVRAYQEWGMNLPGHKIQMTRGPLVLRKKICPVCSQANALVPTDRHPITKLSLERAPRDLQSGFQVKFGRESNFLLYNGAEK